VPGIELPGGGHRDHAGDLAPFAQPLQHRRDPPTRPGRARTGTEAVPGLVKEDDGAAFVAGLIF
jgi:hypothetical protein